MPAPLKRILVMQDNATVALLRQALIQEGYELLETTSVEQALTWVRESPVDMAIIEMALANINGLELARQLRTEDSTRRMVILMLTFRTELEGKVAAFESGADEYLIKPVQGQELVYRIRLLLGRATRPREVGTQQIKRGRIVAFFGTKGGVGRTTIGVNLSVALQRRLRARTVLFDADFFFGDIALHLNLSPSRTILDLVQRIDQLDQELVERVLTQHPSGVRVLLSPRNPEDVESIDPSHIERLLDYFVTCYDYVIVDCQTSYDERTLMILEKADAILLVIKPEVGCVKNMAVFSELAAKLGLSFDKKIHIVLNRAGSKSGIAPKEIERIFRRQIEFQIGSGGNAVVMSVNRGVPLMVEHPNHAFALQVAQIADYLGRNLPPVEFESISVNSAP